MNMNFDEILLELSYRVGIVDLTKQYQVTELINILKEGGYQTPEELANKARVYFSYLNEEDIVKNKKSGNIYVGGVLPSYLTALFSDGSIYANTLGTTTGTPNIRQASGYLRFTSSSSQRYKNSITDLKDIKIGRAHV